MTQSPFSIQLTSPDQTARLAARVGAQLVPGDCILLNGPVGAGKTHFARHLIQSLMTPPEDVPSPTFTLVQTYDTRVGEVWHADLYRITSPHDLEELGLVDAFDQAICLIEWPENLGILAPKQALNLTLSPDSDDDDTRLAVFEWTADRWSSLLDHVTNDA
ncbi:MAG: tRNA threonylcarbamoyladenosine biosynthesis protein TsaE [Paracoccaceae bacterium]|jgi:tRNA threonylcarbamoyladenosine biosynthesis protein TsaE